jgi:hypothetical protein
MSCAHPVIVAPVALSTAPVGTWLLMKSSQITTSRESLTRSSRTVTVMECDSVPWPDRSTENP